jgi:dTDP-4-amino-4,6-dideoxygalactose transaminase
MTGGPGAYLIGAEEKKEIMEVLDAGYLFRYGRLDDPQFLHKTYTFEQELAAYCGVKHALATSSGTGALLCSLVALELKPGDEVIVPAYTFVATYSAIIFAGLVLVLAEIDESLTLDPQEIERRITPRTKAIVPVHMLGNPCNMDAIMDIAQKHGLSVLEDACQAGGGSYKGRKLGSIGHLGAFSLNIFKTITTGDGGAIVTDDDKLYETAFGFHDQGHNPLRAGVEVGKRSIVGLNFRASELLGAVALAQVRKLDQIVSTLHEKKKMLKELIAGVPGCKFRVLNDPEGECGTVCTVIFDTQERADAVSRSLNSATVSHSGWHVYYNMEHVNRHLREIGQPYGKGAYPRTDDMLGRALNISVGVVDAGLGTGFGINIRSDESDIRGAASRFRKACSEAGS